MKTVIVTGGAGYVGSILVRRLLQNGYGVVCLDNLKFGGAALLDIWDHPNFAFEKVDITKHDEVNKTIEAYSDCYGLVHLAAIVGDPACNREQKSAKATNLDASLNLLEQAKKQHIERFIFASTCSNYGKMADRNGYVDEESPLAPVSLYAELKVQFEQAVLNSREQGAAFSPTCLRFATVYGMSPRMRFDLTVNEFAKELAMNRELVIFGEQFWRPYCYVGDFSRAILAVLEAPSEKVAYDVFNVGDTGENYTKQMIADELTRQLPNARIKYVKKEEDPRDYRVNFKKINDRIGFTISKTVPEGINDVIKSIRLGIIDDPENQRFYNIPVGK